MQDNRIETIANLAQTIAGRRTILSATFVNVTPWWGGGPFTDTIICLDSECKQLDYALPNSETVKGLLRWVLRTIYASIEDIEDVNYKDIEKKYVASLFGSTSSESKVHVMVESRICCEKPYYVSYSTLKQLVKCYVENRNVIGREEVRNLLTSFELVGHAILRGHDPSNTNSYFLTGKKAGKQKRNAKMLYDCIRKLGRYRHEAEEFAKLFAIPRFRLISMKVLSKEVFPHKNSNTDIDYFAKLLFSLQPLKPGCIETRISVYWSPRSLALEEDGMRSIRELLLALSVLYVFSILGLGKATSRGFGRFKLEGIQSDNQEVVKNIKEVSTCLWNPIKVEDCLKKIHKLILETLERLYSRKPIEKPSRVPRLSATEIFVGELRHPCRLATLEFTNEDACRQYCDRGRRPIVRDVIEALSAIGKATLKTVWKLYAGAKVREPGVRFHTWILGLPRRPQRTTGYAIDEKGILRRPWNCLRNVEMFGDGRRKSPFFIYPVCDNNTCNVVILFFKTLDDHSSIADKLVHIGEHRNVRGIYHVVHVIDAATRGYVKSECGSYIAGVQEPQQHKVLQSKGKSEIVEQIGEVAFEWLKYILST